MGRKTSSTSLLGYGFIGIIAVVVAAFNFIKENPLIFIIIAVVIVGIIVFLVVRKQTSKTIEGKNISLPNIKVNEEVDKYINSLIDYVYADGSSPKIFNISKKNQHNILCQIFMLDIDLSKYEPFVQDIFENTVNKVNTYKDITDKEEWYESLHFAFESMVASIIQLSTNKTATRDHFKGIDNLSERLLQINGELFKNLFFRLRGYHFWYVYNQDENYKLSLKQIKNRLKIYHGIKQSEFYKKCSDKKDDVSYVLYFAQKANEIVRKEEGRTYRLYLPEDNPDEILPYEFSIAAASDGDFDYKNYWKSIEKELKKNDGILQTEFYSKFNWATEILTRALRDAEKDGKLLREKKGNTYILHLQN